MLFVPTMWIDTTREHLREQIKYNLLRCLPKGDDFYNEIYRYAVLPGGKLFRPTLAMAVAVDHGLETDKLSPRSNHSLLASFLELHHAYTLVHDDLPCMDDDDYRRGRPSLHRKFSEWQALLIGDGLQSAGHYLISQIDGEEASTIQRIATWALGPKGLIRGQFMDLSARFSGIENSGLNYIVEVHKQKTGRMIQLSLSCSCLLLYHLPPAERRKLARDMWRLGESLGLIFQLLDDLSELAEDIPDKREVAINPWVQNYSPELISLLSEHLYNIKNRVDPKEGHSKSRELGGVIFNHLTKCLQNIESKRGNISHHLGGDEKLIPVVMLLKSICHRYH